MKPSYQFLYLKIKNTLVPINNNKNYSSRNHLIRVKQSTVK